MRRNRGSVRRVPYALGVLVLLTIVIGSGCTAWRGAALYHRGTSALDDGDVEGALLDLGRAAELVPDASEIRNHLGLALLAAGREDAARRSFGYAVELDCTNRAASDNLARMEAFLIRESALAAVSSGGVLAPAILAPAVQAPGSPADAEGGAR